MAGTALVVVDMLNDFLDPQGALFFPGGREIIAFVAQRMQDIRQQGGAVIFVCDTHAPDDPEFRRFPPHALKGEWGSQIIPELEVLPEDHRVDKNTYDCFRDNDLEQLLADHEVTAVEVAGVCTSICILEMARGLFFRDLPCRVHSQGVADFDPEAHAFALKYMARVFGTQVG